MSGKRYDTRMTGTDQPVGSSCRSSHRSLLVSLRFRLIASGLFPSRSLSLRVTDGRNVERPDGARSDGSGSGRGVEVTREVTRLAHARRTPIPPPFLSPSSGPPGVSDGVVALGGMEWRECDEHERDVRRDMTAIYFHNLISVSWLEVHPVLSSSHLYTFSSHSIPSVSRRR